MSQAPITAQETVDAMLHKSQRLRVPLRRSLVQTGSGKDTKPGRLADLVGGHDERGLDLYLLMMAVATSEPFRANYEATTWARAIGLRGSAGPTTVSRAWGRLERLALIQRSRATVKIEGVARRVASVMPLREDGSGEPYDRPLGDPANRYFSVPVEYWTREWHRRLSFPAKALLLISLSLDQADGFRLPAERTKDWFGVSADTTERGLNKLRDLKLLDRKPEWKKAPLLGEGYVRVYRYSLLAPFDKASLKRLRPPPGQRSQKGAGQTTE